jgi:CubicO group peptidase (beta-lactamase class C family)
MIPTRSLAAFAVLALVVPASSAEKPKLPGVEAAMKASIAANEIAGAVTLVATKDRIVHLEATGLADVATKKPMSADSIFWIASMTKPVTGVAILMLQDEGKLNVSDPVAKYLPEFSKLKTPSGQPANLTISQILTHTSGLGEATREQSSAARTLADLIPHFLAAPMQYEPGARWQYNQSGINAAGRIVEVISGKPFEVFLQERIFAPLAMKDTTFYPEGAQLTRVASTYRKDATTGELVATPPRTGLGTRDYPPLANGGLYSTAGDYARFAQMLLNGGELDGKRYLSAAGMKLLSSPQTGDLPTGFFQGVERGDYGTNYGWGIGTCVLRTPHKGAAEVLSPGTYGHGGAWGTQAWIDPVKGVAYILMVQRAGHPNSDGSDFRRDFQKAAATAVGKL